MGKRAKPKLIEYNCDRSSAEIKASHDGYSTFLDKLTHLRSWHVTNNALVVKDRLIGNFTDALAFWHIHPAIKLEEKEDRKLGLYLPNGKKLQMEFSDSNFKILENTWCPSFGIEVKSFKIVVEMEQAALEMQMSW